MIEDVELRIEHASMQTPPLSRWASRVGLIQIHDSITSLQWTGFSTPAVAFLKFPSRTSRRKRTAVWWGRIRLEYNVWHRIFNRTDASLIPILLIVT